MSPKEGALAASGTGRRIQTSCAVPRPGPQAHAPFLLLILPLQGEQQTRPAPATPRAVVQGPDAPLASAAWSARRGAPRRLWQAALCDTGDVSQSRDRRKVGPGSGGALPRATSQMTHFEVGHLLTGRAWRARSVSGNASTRVTLPLSQGGRGPSAGAAGSPPRGGSLHVLRAQGQRVTNVQGALSAQGDPSDPALAGKLTRAVCPAVFDSVM